MSKDRIGWFGNVVIGVYSCVLALILIVYVVLLGYLIVYFFLEALFFIAVLGLIAGVGAPFYFCFDWISKQIKYTLRRSDILLTELGQPGTVFPSALPLTEDYVLTVDQRHYEINSATGRYELQLEPLADIYNDKNGWVVDYSVYGNIDRPNERLTEIALSTLCRILKRERDRQQKLATRKKLKEVRLGASNSKQLNGDHTRKQADVG